jgi:hypothetical protein
MRVCIDNLTVPEEDHPVYDLRHVRRLCEEIAIEQDDERAQDLIKLLSAIMREKNDEIVFQSAVLRHKYCSTHNCASVTQASGSL